MKRTVTVAEVREALNEIMRKERVLAADNLTAKKLTIQFVNDENEAKPLFRVYKSRKLIQGAAYLDAALETYNTLD